MCELTHAGTFIGHRVHVLCHRVPGGHPHRQHLLQKLGTYDD